MAISAGIVEGIGGDHIKSTTIGEVPADRSPPIAPLGALSTGSGALSVNPRAELIAHFFTAATRALDAGDMEGARIAHEAAGKLLAATASAEARGAGVVDLERERRRRGG